MKRVCVALLFVAVACDSGSSAPDKDADGFVAVPNAQGLKAKVPDSAKPNGVGGAAGFHSEDGKFAFVLEKVEGDETGKTTVPSVSTMSVKASRSRSNCTSTTNRSGSSTPKAGYSRASAGASSLSIQATTAGRVVASS